MTTIFISHSSKDKVLARKLSQDIQKLGFIPWLDEIEISVGECILTKINEGIKNSDYIVVILSNNSVNSNWIQKEWKSKFWKEINSGMTKIFPILKDNCEIPELLQTKKYADFRESYTIGFLHLMNSIDKIQKKNSVGLKRSESITGKKEYYWNKGVYEYFGLSLNLLFVKFISNKSYYKNNSLSDELEIAGISNYMIFDLYSEWDAVIRFWSTNRVATELSKKLKQNTEIWDVSHIFVEEIEHFHDNNIEYATTEKVKKFINHVGLNGLLELKNESENSQYFDLALSEGILLEDNIPFDYNKIQFYIIIKALKNIGDGVTSNILKKIITFKDIASKTAYITSGTSIRMIVKGQIEDFYGIDDFLKSITTALSNGEITDATTRTILVATKKVKINNQFDFTKAEENIVEKGFQNLIGVRTDAVKISTGERYSLMGKYHSAIEILKMDDQDTIHNLLKAKIFQESKYINKIKNIFPEFEQSLRDNLSSEIMFFYDNNWQEHLDKLKVQQGINKSITSSKLTIGDLAKIYKQIVLNGNIFKLTSESEKKFMAVMDELPMHRNQLVHSAATLEGWERLYDFFIEFIPIRYKFLSHFKTENKVYYDN